MTGSLLTAFVDDVEGGVGDVVIFEEVFGRAGERADEDRVVLWGDERDGGEAQVGLCRHREPQACVRTKQPSRCFAGRQDKHFPFLGRSFSLTRTLIFWDIDFGSCHALAPTCAANQEAEKGDCLPGTWQNVKGHARGRGQAEPKPCTRTPAATRTTTTRSFVRR